MTPHVVVAWGHSYIFPPPPGPDLFEAAEDRGHVAAYRSRFLLTN